MQFSHSNESGNKAGRLLLIAGLHVAIGTFLIHGMNSRHLSLTALPEQVLVMIEPERIIPPPPPPPMPPQTMPKLTPPQLLVAPPEVDVAPPPDALPMQASSTPDPSPAPATQAPSVPDAPPGVPAARTGNAPMRTAVLADAKSCALPDYPARAARDGATGTTVLALLVGADGRVGASRIEHTSGSRELDRAAVNALSLCKFKPATTGGVPEAAWAQLAYVWTLE